MFAIPLDNPETTPPNQCRFDACIVIPNDFQVDNSVLERELSGGEYYVYEVKHTTEEIQKAYPAIFQHLQNNNFQIDHANQLWKSTLVI